MIIVITLFMITAMITVATSAMIMGIILVMIMAMHNRFIPTCI